MLKFFRKGDKLIAHWTSDIDLNCIFKRYDPANGKRVYVDAVPGRAKGNYVTITITDLSFNISELTVE